MFFDQSATKLKGDHTQTAELPPTPYFTRDLLVECYERGDRWGLNRRLNAKVKRLPAKAVFPVLCAFENHHAAFRPVKTHMRCVVVYNAHGDCLIVDVPMTFFNKLPLS